ncbi:hypothetical protein AAES_207028 [Amazona aestiva]|uniref:Protein kinase domain-containing protein n=1 Tax=Amazona aestiva TaxID=12930 RepID=A0A0Q3MIK1_AMAAE|nr:hypothetical protein AAES_207028 [Amazona aestiva]
MPPHGVQMPLAVEKPDQSLVTVSGEIRNEEKDYTARESKMRIKHENIVALEDIYESPNHLYLVMQFWDWDRLASTIGWQLCEVQKTRNQFCMPPFLVSI